MATLKRDNIDKNHDSSAGGKNTRRKLAIIFHGKASETSFLGWEKPVSRRG